MSQINNRVFVCSAIGTCMGIALILKEKFGGPKYTYNTKEGVKKIVIITGANSGIGKATAKELAFRKSKLVLVSRNMEKCERIKNDLIFASRNKNIRCMECDLSSQDSIRSFVDSFNKEYIGLDVLINNAGIMDIKRTSTYDGIEMHLGVNYMGHFLLTNLLLPKLRKSVQGRIINLTSIAYKNGEINTSDFNLAKNYNATAAYNQSQLAIALFTKELSKRLSGTRITVNSVYPGIVNTGLMRHTSFYNSTFSFIFLKPILWIFTKSPKHGCQPVIFAALNSDIKDMSGKLISGFGYGDLFPDEENKELSKWLWDVSVKWSKLNEVNRVVK